MSLGQLVVHQELSASSFCCCVGLGVSQAVVDFVTAKLRDILGLTLFGYDVIVEAHSGQSIAQLAVVLSRVHAG